MASTNNVKLPLFPVSQNRDSHRHSCTILLIICVFFNSYTANIWHWDCESLSSSSSTISGLSSNTQLVTTDPHIGNSCMQLSIIGNDNGNQSSGANVTSVVVGSIINGQWFYYRWWDRTSRR